MVIDCYISVIMLQQVDDFLANLAATLQCSYNIFAIFYLLFISERILYLIDDITIILTCHIYVVIDCYLSVIMLQQNHDFLANWAATS